MASRISSAISVLALVLCAALAASAAAAEAIRLTPRGSRPVLNARPVIGIMQEPVESEFAALGKSFIAGSYVKFFEAGGARVVPVPYTATQGELTKLFSQINGLVFPGGGVDLDFSAYYNASAFLYNLAVQANDRGDYFPIHGTCLGFEMLSIIASGSNMSLLSPFDSENISLPIKLMPDAMRSNILGDMPQDILQTLVNSPVTLNNHRYGVSPASYLANPKLSNTLKLLATSLDREKNEFIAMVEGYKYPFFGTQFHPEKISFEWNADEAIDHSLPSVVANNYFSVFFAQQARYSGHTFASEADLEKQLIYNAKLEYTYALDSTYETAYIFDN